MCKIKPLLAAGLLAASLPMFADEAETASQLKYSVLYRDADDVTHFRDDHLVWRGVGTPATIWVTPLLDATKMGFLRIPAESRSDWHPAPRKQFVMVLEGLMEVEAQDGERRTFAPGSILLVTDTEGRGHRTNALGKHEVFLVWVPVP